VFNLIGSKPSIRYFGADHGYYDIERKPEGLAEYQWQSAHQGGARYAPASFVSGYLNSDVDLEEAIRELEVPVTLAWGREAEITPLSEGRDLAEAADCRLVVVDYAKLQPHAEHPEKFLEGIAEDL
jgi:pimeloyl-ACP methyl ester carboxylesterase